MISSDLDLIEECLDFMRDTAHDDERARTGDIGLSALVRICEEHARMRAVVEAVEKTYYGPAKGHIAVRNWGRLGDALAALIAEESK